MTKPKLVPKAVKVPHGGVKAVAEMLNHLDQDHRERLIQNVTERDPALAQQISDSLFSFDQIAGLADETIQKLIRDVPRNLMALALRKAPPPVEEAIFRNLSTRANENLREEIGMLGPRPASEVQEAQKKIAQIARRLRDEEERP